MEQKPFISIIVPVYKVEEYLSRCVDSILAQTYDNLEIILVDDGSPDYCGSICDTYATMDTRIKVIHKENGGLSSARNAGIEIAKGEYLGFVDSDDWIEPHMYETLLTLAQKHDVKLVCGGRYDFSSRTGRKTIGLCPEREEVITGMELLGRTFLWDNCDSAAWDKLYHRSLFEKIRYPLGQISEDVAIFYKLAELVEKVAMCPKPLYNYYHRPGSITTAALSEKTFHFPKHTAVVYDYIQKNHPELETQARYLRVRGLVTAMQAIDLGSSKDQKAYAEIYRESLKELRTHVSFIRQSPYFTQKERRDFTVLATGCYRYLRKIYHAVK